MSSSEPVKSLIKARFPRAIAVYRDLRNTFTRPSLATIFSAIYRTNAWGEEESVSGRGSTVARTKVIMSHLPMLLQELHAESLLDAACADFNWMRHVELGPVRYIGVDVVPDLINRNRSLYKEELRTFDVLDIAKDRLPERMLFFVAIV